MTEYYRGDQQAGITAPDLSKDASYADHIVKARGKRTQFTSVSTAPEKIRDLGDALYQLKRQELAEGGHVLVGHETLMGHLQAQARQAEKAVKLKAVQAVRYARKRAEGLVDWRFDVAGVQRKDLIAWAFEKVQPFFTRQ